MKVYFIRKEVSASVDGAIIFPYLGAYVDEKMANIAICLYQSLMGNIDTDLFVESSDMQGYPVGRNVLYLNLYQGYDYNYEYGGMFDVNKDIGVFPNIKAAKQSQLYQSCLKNSKNIDPEEFIERPDGSMGYRDSCFDDEFFSYGDVFEGKWVIRVKKLRVYKGDEDGLKDFIINRNRKLCNPQMMY